MLSSQCCQHDKNGRCTEGCRCYGCNPPKAPDTILFDEARGFTRENMEALQKLLESKPDLTPFAIETKRHYDDMRQYTYSCDQAPEPSTLQQLLEEARKEFEFTNFARMGGSSFECSDYEGMYAELGDLIPFFISRAYEAGKKDGFLAGGMSHWEGMITEKGAERIGVIWPYQVLERRHLDWLDKNKPKQEQ